MKSNLKKSLLFTIPLILLSYSSLKSEPPLHHSDNKSYCEQTYEKPIQHKKITKIFIVPGHDKKCVGAVGPAGKEYVLTAKVGKYLDNKLSADPKFEAMISRDENNYDSDLEKYVQENKERLKSELSPCEKLDNYAVLCFAEEHDFDAVISIHFDGSINPKHRGYHLIISPFNRAYQETKNLALNISHQLSLEYKISNSIPRDTTLTEKNIVNEKGNLLNNGVTLRELTVLGTGGNNAKIPTVLIECGFVKNPVFKDSSEQKKLAELIYQGIKRTYDATSTDILRGDTCFQEIALTFDAEEYNQNSEKILNALKETGVKATFFVTGQFVKKYPQIVKELVNRGYEIGNHTYSHPQFTTMNQKTAQRMNEFIVRKELEETDREFYNITQQNLSNLWRAPFNGKNKEILGWAKNVGYQQIGWTIDTYDWVKSEAEEPKYPFYTGDEIKNKILNFDDGNLNGVIILMHLASTRKSETPYEKLPEIITKLKSKGYHFVTVSEVINDSQD